MFVVEVVVQRRIVWRIMVARVEGRFLRSIESKAVRLA